MRTSKSFTKNYSFRLIFIIILPIFPQNYQNSPFYCNFWLKIVEKNEEMNVKNFEIMSDHENEKK